MNSSDESDQHEIFSALAAQAGEPFWLASQRWRLLAPKCAALNQKGKPCGRPAQVGGAYCHWHAGSTARRCTRKLRRGPRSPQQAHAAEMRRLWKVNPWAPGFTVVLSDEARDGLKRWLASNRIQLNWLPPMLVDWITWRFVNLVRCDALDGGEADPVLAELRRRDALMPDEPPKRGAEDLTGASEALAWHPSLTLKGRWVQPSPMRGRKASAAQLARRDKEQMEQAQGMATAWRPEMGPARLTPAEQAQLDDAVERDRRRGASVQVERAHERIDAARRFVREQAEIAAAVEADHLRAQTHAEIARLR